MTAQKTAAAGVACIPQMKNQLLMSKTVHMPAEIGRTVIAALELLKPVADGTHSILPNAALETAENDALWREPTEADKNGHEYLLEIETPTSKERWRAVASYRQVENGDEGWAENGEILCQDEAVKLLIPMTDLPTIPPLPASAIKTGETP